MSLIEIIKLSPEKLAFSSIYFTLGFEDSLYSVRIMCRPCKIVSLTNVQYSTIKLPAVKVFAVCNITQNKGGAKSRIPMTLRRCHWVVCDVALGTYLKSMANYVVENAPEGVWRWSIKWSIHHTWCIKCHHVHWQASQPLWGTPGWRRATHWFPESLKRQWAYINTRTKSHDDFKDVRICQSCTVNL